MFASASVVPSSLVQCVVDNLDFHKDTADGKTLHATSHNTYQYNTHNNSEQQGCVIPHKMRSRSTEKESMFETPQSNVTIANRCKARSLSPGKLSHCTLPTKDTDISLVDDTVI